MADLGPQTQAVDSVGFDGELGAWCVGFENESMLLLEWFGEQDFGDFREAVNEGWGWND